MDNSINGKGSMRVLKLRHGQRDTDQVEASSTTFTTRIRLKYNRIVITSRTIGAALRRRTSPDIGWFHTLTSLGFLGGAKWYPLFRLNVLPFQPNGL